MKSKFDNGELTLYLHGRIDSNNAHNVEKEALECVHAHSPKSLVADAENLEYISRGSERHDLPRRQRSDPQGVQER